MTPASEQRIRAAVAELADALVAAVAESDSSKGPVRLLSVAEAAELTGLGRTSIYAAIGAGRVRSVVVGRRRLIPASAIAELAGE